MPEMIELLKHRRSVPPQAMSGPGPSAEELDTILSLAARVPDHGKLAPWRFLIFEGEARARAGELFARVLRADHPEADDARIAIERGRLTRAPVVVAVVSRAAAHVKIPEWEQQLSAGAVCMTMIVAANALGFVTSWLTEWIAYDARVRSALGLAAHERIAGFIFIGRAAERPADRTRPVLAELVTRF